MTTVTLDAPARPTGRELWRTLMRGLLPNAVERDAAAFTSVAAGLAMPGVTEAAITS